MSMSLHSQRIFKNDSSDIFEFGEFAKFATAKKILNPALFPPRPKEVASLHHIPRKSNTMGCCNSKQKEITRPSVIRKSATLEKNELPLSILLTGGQKLRESNLTGRGVKVAVIDSGVDKDHPGFNGQVKKQVWYRKGTPLEEDDHGTHVAGTVHLMAPQVKNDSNKRCMSIASHALIQKSLTITIVFVGRNL